MLDTMAGRSKYNGTAADLQKLLLPFVKQRATWLSYYEKGKAPKKSNGEPTKKHKAQPKNLLECPRGMWHKVRAAQRNFAIQKEKVKVVMPLLWDECRAFWPVLPSEDAKEAWCNSMVERFHNACLDLAAAQRKGSKWVEKICRDPEDLALM